MLEQALHLRIVEDCATGEVLGLSGFIAVFDTGAGGIFLPQFRQKISDSSRGLPHLSQYGIIVTYFIVDFRFKLSSL